MIKLFDNTVISSMGKEISQVDVLPLVLSKYPIYITESVKTECYNSHDSHLICSISDLPIAIQNDSRLDSLKKAIKKSNFVLGWGEIDTISSSILLTDSGFENYAVIDDKLARKIAQNIHCNRNIIDIVGSEIPPIKLTGTVGLIKHLRDKGVISSEEAKKIAFDLEKSSFRISNELLSLLK